ncbi:MAG TPA: NAD-dependent epimerase/dehydratase family protein [Vicinamibacterales bacterium]|nr:NAD-dependent epimerase/dehydratase family protein [Vicinamibacterales bacterium]
MRVFLTGGTGYVGAAVLDSLVRGGHHVDVLVRNSEGAARVQARGGHPVLGDLVQSASWRDAAAAADGAIHAAVEYSPRQVAVDSGAIDGLLSLPEKRGRFLIYTSGIWVLGSAPDPVDETAPVNAIEIVSWRPAHEQRVLAAAASGVRAIVVRPGIVYGGARGIVGDLLKDAANSLVRIVGPGENHWPLIYERDLGELYARLVGTPTADGIYHATDGGAETVNEIVTALADHAPTQPSVRHMPLAEARKKMGPYADALALDQIVRSPRARALGWTPTLHSVAGNAARLFEEWRRGKAA